MRFISVAGSGTATFALLRCIFAALDDFDGIVGQPEKYWWRRLFMHGACVTRHTMATESSASQVGMAIDARVPRTRPLF